MTNDASRPEGHHRKGARIISIAAVLLLVLGAAGAYQLGRTKHPAFRRGGVFASARQRVASNGSPTIDPTTGVTVTPATGIPNLAAGPSATGAPTRTTPASAPTTPAATSGPLSPSASGPLALGVYTYALSGSESATGFGSRQYPADLTMTAHSGPGVAKDQAVLDLFFSKDHSERDIVAYKSDSIAFTFEGGAITFGPATQTSEADYAPPMVQIPLPLRAGDTCHGTTEARSSNGSVSRVEDWTVSVVKQETLKIAGQDVPTWVVTLDRKTRKGSADQSIRNRTYWYDPARRIWVKWHEKMHGERKTLGFTFTYDTTYDAVLSRFTAA